MFLILRYTHGRRLRGNWGDGRSPPKFEVGDGPCIRPPIFREVGLVLSDACESNNGVKKSLNFCSEIEVFLVKKGLDMVYITFQTVKTGKNRND